MWPEQIHRKCSLRRLSTIQWQVFFCCCCGSKKRRHNSSNSLHSCGQSTGRQFLFWPGCLIVLRVSLYRTRESLAPAIAIFGDGQRIKTATTTRSLSLSLYLFLFGHGGTPKIIILGFSFQLAKRALIANVPCSQIPRLRVHHWFIPRNVKEPPN